MLKDGVVLSVICLILAGGIFLWWTQTSARTYGAPADPQFQQPEPAPKPAPVVVKTVVKPKPIPAPVEQPAVIPAPPVVAEAAPVVKRDPRPFPAVDQIPTGVHEDSITTKYGDPALSAVTSTGGHMVETFVYARQQGRSATVIRLEDGKVSSAYTQSEPVLPPGLSAPRRWHNY